MFARLMGLSVIAPRHLHERMQTEPIQVFDVNAESRWREAHVPGARRLDPVAFTAGDLPENRAATIVFYCSNPLCRKAPHAAKRAQGLGYSSVHVMSAGITGWVDASLPTESDRAAPSPPPSGGSPDRGVRA